MAGKKITLCIRVFGGLGNQLFIFAYAYAFGLRYNCDVFFDLKTGFVRDKYGRKPAIGTHVKQIKEARIWHFLLLFLSKKRPVLSHKLFNSIFFLEKDFRQLTDFSRDILEKCSIAFVQGYFQSPVYFDDYADQIKNKIKFDFFKSNEVLAIADLIAKTNSVSIHIRRVQYDNLLEIEYYRKAIELLNKKSINPIFFIFSDDIAWCQKHFENLGEFDYVKHDVEDEAADLWLMSQCRNHIIANSSFSWWGAYLSNHSSKIVIAPKDTQIGVRSNFYPKDWIEI